MLTYLLETSAFSDVMREHPKTVAHLASVSGSCIVVCCTIVRGEILYGIERMAAGKRKQELEIRAAKLFGIIPCEAVPADGGDRYATAKWSCRRKGLSVDDNDLWIAATALALGAVLVTRDSDFQKIDGLTVEDWSS